MNRPSFPDRMRQLAPLMLVLISAAIAMVAYLQAFDYPFVSDDRIQIENNAKLAGLHAAELWRLFTEPYNAASEFLPLRDLSYWCDMTLFGLNPSAFRLHNIILHLLCLPLVYGVTSNLWRYFRPADVASASWAAAAVTALFALHPALVESVVWISGRKYVLPNLFSMLALWFAVSARRERGFSSPYAAAALLAFVAVMLSKASYVAVAPVIATLWVIFWRDIPAPDRHRSLLLWPLAILFLAGFLVLIFISRSMGTTPAYFGVEAFTRTLAVLGWLARLAVSPENRHFFYPVFEDPSLPFMVELGLAVLAAAAAGAVMILRKRSLEGFVLVAFLLLCMPYMQLVPHAPPSLVSDRFLALAVWPAVLLVVALSWRLNPVPRTALLLAIALPWGFQTMERSRDWRNFETITDTDLRAYPGYYMPAVYKIVAALPRGLYREASETASSITIAEYRDIMVKLVKADYAVNVEAVATGKPDQAIALLRNLESVLRQPPVQSMWNPPIQVVWEKCRNILVKQWMSLARQFPDDATVRYSAGLWMSEVGYYKDAIAHLHAAIGSQYLPESVRGVALKNLGLALIGSGHIAEAEAPLRAALEQPQPDIQAYCLLSVVYKLSNRAEEAARAEASCPDRASNY